MTSPGLQPLAWDSEWLGFPVARAAGAELDDPAAVAALVAQGRAAGIRLLYLVLDPGQGGAAGAAQAHGAQLLDARLTLAQPSGAPPPLVVPVGTRLELAEAITPALRRLAVQSGEHSRFRHDERIGRVAFEALYTHWLHRSFAEGQVWSVTTPAAPVGLLAFAGHGRSASIELLAVDATARRRGIGQLLVQAARQAAYQQGYDKLRVVTQGANQPARRLYEGSGFQLLRTEHIYHLWL